MQIGAGHAPIGRHRAIAHANRWPAGRGRNPARGAPEMDFISGNRRAALQMRRRDRPHDLVAREHRVDGEQAKAGAGARQPLDPVRIADRAAKHLIAAAQAEHAPATPHMGGQIDVPPLRPEESQIGDGRFRAGQDDEIGIRRQRLAGRHQPEIDLGLLRQGIEIIEIRDAAQ